MLERSQVEGSAVEFTLLRTTCSAQESAPGRSNVVVRPRQLRTLARARAGADLGREVPRRESI